MLSLPLPSRIASCAAVVLLVLAVSARPPSILAQTWDGDGPDDFWTTGLNWSGNVPPANNGAAVITFAGTTRLNPILNASYSIASLTFSNTAGAFTLSSINNADLGIGSGGITNNSAQAQTISTHAVGVNADQSWNAAAGNLAITTAINLNGHTVTLSGNAGKILTLGVGGVTGTGSIVLNAGTDRFDLVNSLDASVTLKCPATEPSRSGRATIR